MVNQGSDGIKRINLCCGLLPGQIRQTFLKIYGGPVSSEMDIFQMLCHLFRQIHISGFLDLPDAYLSTARLFLRHPGIDRGVFDRLMLRQPGSFALLYKFNKKIVTPVQKDKKESKKNGIKKKEKEVSPILIIVG